MKSLLQYEPGKLAILLVGNQKTGKSRIMGSFPNPYFIDFDGNLKSLVNAEPSLADKVNYYDPFRDEKGNTIEEHQVYPKMLAALKKDIQNPLCGTLILDSLTTMMDPLKAFIIHKNDKTGRRSSGGMQMSDWEELRKTVLNLLNFMRATLKPVIWSSHQKLEFNSDGAIVGQSLAIQGQLKDYLGASFTDVWGTDTKIMGQKVSYLLHTSPKKRSVPLGRSVELPNEMDLSNLKPTQIWKLLEQPLGLSS